MKVLKHLLLQRIRQIIQYFNDRDIQSIPKPNVNNFLQIVDYNYNNIKVVIIDSQPFNRPDSSGLSCFKEVNLKVNFEDSFYHKRLKMLFGEDFSVKDLPYYQEQGILFLNLSFTTSPNKSLEHLVYWKECIDYILKYFHSINNRPIIISIGGNMVLKKLYEFYPSKIDLLTDVKNNVVLEHIPEYKTCIIDLGNIQDLHSNKFEETLKTFDIKNITNKVLVNRKLKKINWL